MNRRSFLHAGGVAAGALLLPSFLARAAGLPAGFGQGPVTFGVQVATSPAFEAQTLVLDAAGLADPRFTFTDLDTGTQYFWRANATDGTTTTPWSETFDFSAGASVATEEAGYEFRLDVNRPNPFRTTTTIPFELATPGPVELAVYNVLGQRVATLVDGDKPAGPHEVVWDARDLASGTYLVILQAGAAQRTLRLTLAR